MDYSTSTYRKRGHVFLGAGKNGPSKNGPGKNGPGKNGPEKTVR